MAEALTAEEISARVEEIISAHADLEGPLLPILHEVQETFGYVPRDALPVIASGLNLSRAEVHGVMSFYHDFREDRAGRHVLKLCRAEACQSLGADRIAEQVRGKLGIEWHETTQDGAVTLDPVFCLGLCACGPAAMVDGKLVGRVDDTRVEDILSEVRS